MMSQEIAATIKRAQEARRNGHLKTALAEYEYAVDRAKSLNLMSELIAALSGVGQIKRDQGKMDEASANYRDAVELCRNHNYTSKLGHALKHLADVERERGHYENALNLASEAVEIFRQEVNITPLSLANTLRVWALTQEALGHAEPAKLAWQEARGLYKTEGIEAGMSECDAHLSD